MSYFRKFPQILYSFDSGNTVGAFPITDILRRVKANDANIQNVLSYDKYDVRDGETPEILADKFYNDSGLHWVLLIANEILDPRWDWPLENLTLLNYIEGKYGLANINAVHHYENSSGDTVYFKAYTGTVDVAVTGASSNITVVGTGTAFVSQFLHTGVTVRFNASTTAYTVVAINSNTSLTISGSAITSAVNTGTMIDNNSYLGSKTIITNTDYETTENENRRSIKVLKAQFVPQFIQNFTGLLKNGRE